MDMLEILTNEGLGEVWPYLEDNLIYSIDTAILLNNEELKEMIPKIGPRIKFKNWLQQQKAKIVNKNAETIYLTQNAVQDTDVGDEKQISTNCSAANNTVMAPYVGTEDKICPSDDEGAFVRHVAAEAKPWKYKIVYPLVLVLLYWHLAGLYGLYLSVTSVKWPTLLFSFFTYILGGIGVSAGVHRLWSHRAYKATLPLQILLMLMQSSTGQQCVIVWARYHRVHHKYCDTDADPHNATRGFFFSHIGWLMVKEHPDFLQKARTIDIADLLSNPVLRFQKKYYNILAALFLFILPTLIPMYFWQESFNNAYHVALLKLVIGSNITFAINSVAHKFGNKPYDINTTAIENVGLSLITFGEGYHNFHHIFPFDYRVSELNQYFKFSTYFLEFCAWLGLAYDLKYAPDDMILRRAKRTGDGTHQLLDHADSDNNIWGWGDEDMPEEDKIALNSQNSGTNYRQARQQGTR